MNKSSTRPIRAKFILSERGLTIAAVAQTLAMDPAHLGKVLAGKSTPTRRTMLQISNLLGLDETAAFPEYAVSASPDRATA